MMLAENDRPRAFPNRRPELHNYLLGVTSTPIFEKDLLRADDDRPDRSTHTPHVPFAKYARFYAAINRKLREAKLFDKFPRDPTEIDGSGPFLEAALSVWLDDSDPVLDAGVAGRTAHQPSAVRRSSLDYLLQLVGKRKNRALQHPCDLPFAVTDTDGDLSVKHARFTRDGADLIDGDRCLTQPV